MVLGVYGARLNPAPETCGLPHVAVSARHSPTNVPWLLRAQSGHFGSLASAML